MSSLTLFETPILSGECWHNLTHGLKAKINFGSRKFFRKNCGSKKILIREKILKNFAPKNFGFESWYEGNLSSKFFLGPIKFLV